jgi:hypothetical protein
MIVILTGPKRLTRIADIAESSPFRRIFEASILYLGRKSRSRLVALVNGLVGQRTDWSILVPADANSLRLCSNIVSAVVLLSMTEDDSLQVG